MFVITNRRCDENGTDLDLFGSTPNDRGPNELRIVEVSRTSGKAKWKAAVLPDALTDEQRAFIERGTKLRMPKGELYASHYAAVKVLSEARKSKKNVVLFVHGYNNNIRSVVERAARLERNFGVIVVPFSWPANGGGNVVEDVSGLLSYKSDKRDARASTGAFDRCLCKIHERFTWFNRHLVAAAEKKAHERFGDDLEARQAHVAEAADCPTKVTLLLHSMGNYLLKSTMSSSAYLSEDLLTFDNVVLCAADTNNKDHADWVDRLRYRNRVFVTINENDKALRVSRLKIGKQQLARLGHCTGNLTSREALYVNVTTSRFVGDSHAYFEEQPLRNDELKGFFRAALNGERAEESLPKRAWDPAKNLYGVR